MAGWLASCDIVSAFPLSLENLTGDKCGLAGETTTSFPVVQTATLCYILFLINFFCVRGKGTACIERSEDNLQELVFYLHMWGHRGQTQVIRLGSKCLYSVSHLIIYVCSRVCVCGGVFKGSLVSQVGLKLAM